MSNPEPAAPWSDAWQIIAGGERVTHLYQNDCYFGHLAVYRFAVDYCRGRRVLDAGSGAGYGAAYLADRGARTVLGIDVSPDAIAFSRHHFSRPNLEYRVIDLNVLQGRLAGPFDVVFSSNVLEHLTDVPALLREVWRILAPDGVLLVGVPPITTEALRDLNLANRFHLNIWSPRQWHYTLGLYFAEVACYKQDFHKPGVTLDLSNRPEEVRIDEDDFLFRPVTLEEMSDPAAICAIFVARAPRSEAELPAENAPLAFVDESFTRPPPVVPAAPPPPSTARAARPGLADLARRGWGRLLRLLRAGR